MSRQWEPCRVCGQEHTNPQSSSICSPCGQKESADRIEAERAAELQWRDSPFGQFMALPEDERWQMVFEHMERHA